MLFPQTFLLFGVGMKILLHHFFILLRNKKYMQQKHVSGKSIQRVIFLMSPFKMIFRGIGGKKNYDYGFIREDIKVHIV